MPFLITCNFEVVSSGDNIVFDVNLAVDETYDLIRDMARSFSAPDSMAGGAASAPSAPTSLASDDVVCQFKDARPVMSDFT